MSIFGYLTAVSRVEKIFTDHFDLLAQQENPRIFGTWKGHPVSLRASSWSGKEIALFRTVTVVGEELEIANILAVAASPSSAPIFGADLVAARADAGVVIADLSPLGGSSHANPSLPPWAQGIFSATPLVERVTPATAPAAIERVMPMIHAFIDEAKNAAAIDPTEWHAAVARYRTAHFQDDRMQMMLAHMFGAERSSEIMHNVLFPAIKDVDVHA